ncbi:hypothetical protein [Priestia taiwanensis]|uniref:Uncharacterized protein n=1 Tax=Priestia taiwanensis TaxID=1347902 RepID=A0A917AU67_9BACI|nr:hypothetical protein [Priestia taiwanensis]MBM7363977.1 hypothetical protein [Priestia taiwanensis]GGE70664.1 hypothetical protein GCM10007140_20670 [Priestia taiwanensis]
MYQERVWQRGIDLLLFTVFVVSFYLGEYYFLIGLILIAVGIPFRIFVWQRAYGRIDFFILLTLGVLAIGICVFQLFVYFM